MSVIREIRRAFKSKFELAFESVVSQLEEILYDQHENIVDIIIGYLRISLVDIQAPQQQSLILPFFQRFVPSPKPEYSGVVSVHDFIQIHSHAAIVAWMIHT